MKVNQAFRYELQPNVCQHILLAKHAGTARFAYNWGLAERIKLFEMAEGKDRFTTATAQHKILNSKKTTEFPWMYEVSKCSPQEALRDLDKAFNNFWTGRKQGRKVGFPKFKKKGDRDSFRLTGSIRVSSRSVQLPRLGKVRTKEATIKFVGRILSATVVREADRWFVSLSVEVERPDPLPVKGEVAISSNSRCWMGRVPNDAGVQDPVVWLKTRHSTQVLCFQQDLFRVWLCDGVIASRYPRVGLSLLWHSPRPRR